MSCGCATCEDNLIIDPVVLNEGDDGSDGLFGGFSGDWLFETNTSAPPSTRCLRVNNSSLASVTEIYIHSTNAANISYTAFLAEFAANGYIKIGREFNSSVFYTGKITSVTVIGAYTKLVVTTVLSNGAFANGERLILSYTPTNVVSTSNVEILANDCVADTISASVFTNIRSETIPAASLITNGDLLKCKLIFSVINSVAGGGASYFRVRLNNADIDTNLVQWELSNSHPRVYVDFDLTRESNTQLCVSYRTESEDLYNNLRGQTRIHTIKGGFNLTGLDFTIDLEGKTSAYAGELVRLEEIQIIKYIQ